MVNGPQTVKANAGLSKISPFVKAGAIVPMSDYMQSTEDISSTSTEIRIYEGADGQCTLYEDEGNNYNYENGVFSKIDFHWNDKRKHLVLVRSKGNLKVCSHIELLWLFE